jgi:hypothetical protein
MPDNNSPDTEGADQPDTQGADQSETADFSNRAARRRRGKGTSSPQTFGKVQAPGRNGPVQGPRQWSTRRSG